ncbi:helix-turn-helix transcriptional regulator [Vibrio algarum]|uniref:AraC family transcriptional regulator n=1 Tax=Vibrio algarum TaxID=3020714 RepID=A0ABT4YXC5_9VIBR|nr:response regulator transcription factor [Vibrio sp. KJ40-1]MDB1126237.1 AraC family transcriptional regulator [Vibrio sp. KJ40-1]
MKNNPLVIRKSVSCTGITIRSYWDVNADKAYQNVWPRDRKLPYADNTLVVVYTESGQGVINVKNADSIHIRGNSLIFLDPQSISSYGCTGLAWKLYWIEIFIEEEARKHIPFNSIINIENRVHYELQLEELKKQLNYNETYHNAYAAAIFTKVFYEWLVNANFKDKTPQQKVIDTVVDEMYHRISENWTVKEMATFVGCSEQHMRKLFTKQTGKSPKEYYMTIKLEIAHTLLKKGTHNITQLAYELAFTDAFHLSKAFKKIWYFSLRGHSTSNECCYQLVRIKNALIRVHFQYHICH